MRPNLLPLLALLLALAACKDDSNGPPRDTHPVTDGPTLDGKPPGNEGGTPDQRPADSARRDGKPGDSGKLVDGKPKDSGKVDGKPKDSGLPKDSKPLDATAFGQANCQVLQGTTAVVGATVTVLGTSPPVTATSNSFGDVSLVLPAGVPRFLRAEKTGMMKSIVGVVADATAPTDCEIEMITSTDGDDALSEAGLGTRDKAKGLVEVLFNGAAGTGGEKATISLTHGGSFVENSSGTFQASAQLLSGGGEVLFFANVTPGNVSLTSITSAGGKTCSLAEPLLSSMPVQADTVSFVELECK